jgi:hypothetical protein
LFASLVLPGLAGPLSASITRDLLPCVLILLFYSLAGLFVTGANAGLEARLLQLDRLLVAPPLIWCAGRFFGPWLLGTLELAYLSYYVALPGAAATLRLAGRGKEADHFWTVVLLAAYASCGMLAFEQTRPPRVLTAVSRRTPFPAPTWRLSWRAHWPSFGPARCGLAPHSS